MPWKSLGPGKFSFSGPIITWAELFRKWFKEDSQSSPGLVYESYFSALVFSYAGLAKNKWNEEWLGGRKARILDSFVESDEDGQLKVKLFDTLDYLADNLTLEDRKAWEKECRTRAKSILKIA
jgi:flavodoxin